MKVLFLDPNPQRGRTWAAQLESDSLLLVPFSEATNTLSLLQSHPDIGALITRQPLNDALTLVNNLKSKFPSVVYLAWLEQATPETEASILLQGMDFVLSGDNPSQIKAQLTSIYRLQARLTPFTSGQNFFNKQIIDLNQGQLFSNHDLNLFFEILQILVENISSLSKDWGSVTPSILDELKQNALSLGTEELAHWLGSAIRLLDLGQFKEALQKGLEQEFQTVFSRLCQAIEALNRFDYFSSKKKDQPAEVLAGRKILIVEDMTHNRILLTQILKKYHPHILEAKQGQEALEVWEKEKPLDIIIMDMNMPIMDGFEATQQIRRKEKELGLEAVPILALTALAMRGDQNRCFEAGCDSYLPKPIDNLNLVAVVTQMINDKTPETCDLPHKTPFEIKKIGIFTPDQVYQVVLKAALDSMGHETELLFDNASVINQAETGDFDLLILDVQQATQLVIYIRETYPNQEIALFCNHAESSAALVKRLPQSLHHPINLASLTQLLRYHATHIKEVKRNRYLVEDFSTLKAISEQSHIQETIERSQGQLAVWQKTFRKIGGDLVISHRFNRHGRFGLILADVSGHDIQSGYTAAWFAGLIKGVWAQKPDPLDLLRHLNSLSADHSEEEDKRYVCALALLWDPLRNKLKYANAGIPGGILTKKETSKVEFLNWKGVPVGMFPGEDLFEHGEIDFHPGDRLFLATDGVLEQIPEEVIASLSQVSGKLDAEKALEGMVDFILRSMQVSDDLTLAVFDPKWPELAPGAYRNSFSSDLEETYAEVQRMKAWLNGATPLDFDWPMTSVALKEALLNAVEHGNRNNPKKFVDVDAEILPTEPPTLQIRVSDCGKGFDLRREKKRIAAEGQLRIQGRGLMLIEHIAQAVTFDGSTVLLHFSPL